MNEPIAMSVVPWYRREDTSAIVIALGLVLAATVAFLLGFARAVSTAALSIPTWSDGGTLVASIASRPAAGFAAASALGDERAVKTFTLMKVVGRDMFVGVWAVVVAFLSVTRWARPAAGEVERAGPGEIWRRFPKFILGFLAASLAVTTILAFLDTAGAAGYSKHVIGSLKTLRGWAFTWTFLSIGFTTRFRELLRFGWRPFAAFAVGVLINVPIGYWLSTSVFGACWLTVK